MKLNSLASKVIISLLATASIVFGISTYREMNLQRARLLEDWQVLHSTVLLNIASTITKGIWDLDNKTLEIASQSVFQFGSFEDFQIFKDDGTLFMKASVKKDAKVDPVELVTEGPTLDTLEAAFKGTALNSSENLKKTAILKFSDLSYKTEANNTQRIFADLWYLESGSEEAKFVGVISAKYNNQTVELRIQDQKKRTVISVLILAGSLVLLMFLVVQMGIVRRLKKISNTTQKLAKGEQARIQGEAGSDEISVLSQNFNSMADALLDYQQNLEGKIIARTATIAEREKSIGLMLDNSGDGFLTVDLDGKVLPLKSKVVAEWFPESHDKEHLWDIVFSEDLRQADNFNALFHDLSDNPDLYFFVLDQLPSRTTCGGRFFNLVFKPILNGDTIQNVLTIVQDVTEALKAEKAEKERAEMACVFERLMKDKTGFIAFAKEISSLCAYIKANCNDLSKTASIKRNIHTIKGNCGSFGLTSLAEVSHEVENQIALSAELGMRSAKDICSTWDAFVARISEFLSLDESDIIEVQRSDFENLLVSLNKGVSLESLQRTLASWQRPDITASLARLRDAAVLTGRKINKTNFDVRIEGNGLRLPDIAWGDFWGSLVHVVRNAVDHGIESPAERAKANKSERGSIVLTTLMAPDGALLIEISDDGKGVQWQAIAQKAAELKLPNETTNDLVAALFYDGISTSDAVTDVSGRGIGTAASKESIERLGGKVEVMSEAGQGTLFRFVLPAATLLLQQNEDKQAA